jgi:hypothetical protein
MVTNGRFDTLPLKPSLFLTIEILMDLIYNIDKLNHQTYIKGETS